jgi:hypothetical protein
MQSGVKTINLYKNLFKKIEFNSTYDSFSAKDSNIKIIFFLF